ncbi:MAG TPA: DMT family transporter [Methylibium sp.]|nr:DMT family transporter [Methylibium sp.]
MTSTPVAAVLALTLNAFVWGVSWWPLRRLHEAGLHPLWATALVYVVVVAVIAVVWRRALGQLARTPVLWVLAAAAGCTNATFNWGVSIGDVVRVVLLFYLMPLWSVLLARLLLHERLTAWAALRIALALAGAAIVLKPAGAGWPLPASLPDWLGIAGGFSFALNNVMLRREARQPPEARALAMFVGGAAVSGLLALVLGALDAAGGVPLPPAPTADWLLVAALLTVAMMAANLSLQYGAARLPAHTTAVVMLTEIVFATVSAVWLGDQVLTGQVWLGGALILAAAALSAAEPEPEPATA